MTQNNRVLKQSLGYYVEDMDGEKLLFRPTSNDGLLLNSSAALIWTLCDGTRSTEDIVDVLRENYQEATDDLETDVKDVISRLMSDGALILAPPQSP